MCCKVIERNYTCACFNHFNLLAMESTNSFKIRPFWRCSYFEYNHIDVFVNKNCIERINFETVIEPFQKWPPLFLVAQRKNSQKQTAKHSSTRSRFQLKKTWHKNANKIKIFSLVLLNFSMWASHFFFGSSLDTLLVYNCRPGVGPRLFVEEWYNCFNDTTNDTALFPFPFLHMYVFGNCCSCLPSL